MDAQTVRGVVLILVIGVTVLIIAALVDFRSARRAAAAMAAPPPDPNDPDGDSENRSDPAATDDNPSEKPNASPAPHYIPATEAHARSPRRTLDDDEQAALAEPGAVDLSAQLVDDRLFTHRSPTSLVVRGARVLCCPEGIGNPREVMQTLERSAQDHTPVVLVAPTIDPEVVDLLVVNTARGNLTGGAITVDAADCITLAQALGGYAVTRADLQSGYVPHSAYGTATCVAIDQARARFWPLEAAPEQA